MFVVFPETYPYVLAGLSAHFLFNMMLMPIIGRAARVSVFTKDFMSQFEQEHADAIGRGKPDATGNPDQGTGWYSKKLKLGPWLKLNAAQRILANYMEMYP